MREGLAGASATTSALPSVHSMGSKHSRSNAGLAEHNENETPVAPPETPALAQCLKGEATAEEVKQEPTDESPMHQPLSSMLPIRFAVDGPSPMLPQPLQDTPTTDAAQAMPHDEQPAVKQEPPSGPSVAAGPSRTSRKERGFIDLISDSGDEEAHQVSEPGTAHWGF